MCVLKDIVDVKLLIDINLTGFIRRGIQASLSTPMGVDYVVIGFDMEVQPMQLDLYA